jgi:protein of hypothetical function DUF214
LTINKKLFRDLLEHKGANIAAIIVIAIGIMMYSGAAISMDTLIYSKENFYEKANFPSAYAKLISVNEKVIYPLEEIKGVKKVELRLIQDVKIPDTSKTIRLISQTDSIGKYIIKQGRKPVQNNYEILPDSMFAKANGYKIGDKIEVISSGRKKELTVCGISSSAENIYSLKDISQLMPNPEKFGVAFIDITSLQNLTGKKYFNEIIFEFEEGVEFEDVKNEIEKELQSYGLISLYSMKDQSSNSMIEGEIEEQKAMMITMPIIFLSVSVLVMSIMIKRIIQQQRGQIGILKAFGYSDFEVGLHYSLYCMILGTLGAVIGSFMGITFADLMLDLYKQMFNMDFVNNSSFLNYFIIGILISCAFSIFAGASSSLNAVKIAPSEAMRQEVPQGGKKVLLEYLPFFDIIFNSRGKMSIRNIFRNGKRSFFIIIGLALAFSISIMPWTMLSIMKEMVFDRYEYVEKYDAKIFLSDISSKKEVENALNSFENIIYKQALAEIPSTVTHKGVSQDVVIVGLPKDSKLYTIVDDKKRPIQIQGGIMLSEKLAEKLGADIGDEINIKSPYAKYKKDKIFLKVTKIVEQGVGMNGYMDIDQLSKKLGYDTICNSILIDVKSPEDIETIRDKYQNSEKVISVQSKTETINQLNKRMNSMYSVMYFMAIIASAMTFAIVYNTFVVVLMERKREMSTLMVLGMKEKDVLSIISLEQWITSIIGMILGIPLAQALIIVMSKELTTDSFTMPTDMKSGAIILAVILMIVSIIAAQILASRKVNTIDIVEVLKSGE